MEDKRKVALNILRSCRIGNIVCKIAKRLDISLIDAMRRFYDSETCKDFHDRMSGMYLQGDLYVVAEFMDEINGVKRR